MTILACRKWECWCVTDGQWSFIGYYNDMSAEEAALEASWTAKRKVISIRKKGSKGSCGIYHFKHVGGG
jgi:hypothetical protein